MNLQTGDVQFFSSDPFSGDYLSHLRRDLDGARWVRFLVCYFSEDGHDALSPLLAGALEKPGSRGIVSLTCSCGAEGVRKLWHEAGRPRGVLKCFLPVKREAPADAKLLHSKMAVILRPSLRPGGPDRAILYTGSHNWTGPGLRVRGNARRTMNVEASVRVEMDWEPAWLDQVSPHPRAPTGQPILDALNHIERCFHLVSCSDLADPATSVEMERWLETMCRLNVAPPGSTPFIVVPGVVSGAVDARTAKTGTPVPRRGPLRIPRRKENIFVQQFKYREEPESFDSASAWALFLWGRTDDLASARQPWLLLCRPRLMGQVDVGSPTLQDVDWLLYEPRHNTPSGTSARQDPESTLVKGLHLRSGVDLEVEHWRLAPVRNGTRTRDLNHGAPYRSVLLEVLEVRRPVDEVSSRAEKPWKGTELVFHNTRNRTAQKAFVVHDPSGDPSPARADAMRREQSELFDISTKADTGPTGDLTYRDHDVFPCAAPINDLTFLRRDVSGISASILGRERPVFFEVAERTIEPDPTHARVPRMERLFAPAIPLVAKALGLEEDVRLALNLKE